MIRLNTDARHSLATVQGLAPMFSYGHIELYTGPTPATPDSAPTGTLLGYITHGDVPTAANHLSNGLLFNPGPILGSIADNTFWKTVIIASGTVGWWRLVSVYSLLAPQFSYPTIDGTAGDLFIANSPAVVSGVSTPIRTFLISIPQQGA